MAKELPYFQFEPAEYLTKDVSFCSLSAQGLFINICSYYWQRQCELTKGQLLRRLNYTKELEELIDEGVVKIENENIIITFLDQQFEKATLLKKTNSINGSKGGRPPKKKPIKTEPKPNINPINSETKGIREDNIRKDNISKKEKNIYRKFAHLTISKEEFDKLNIIYSKTQIDDILDRIENYKLNTKYKVLYLTANAWLKKEHPHLKTKENKEEGGMTEWEIHQAKVKLVQEQAMRGE